MSIEIETMFSIISNNQKKYRENFERSKLKEPQRGYVETLLGFLYTSSFIVLTGWPLLKL